MPILVIVMIALKPGVADHVCDLMKSRRSVDTSTRTCAKLLAHGGPGKRRAEARSGEVHTSIGLLKLFDGWQTRTEAHYRSSFALILANTWSLCLPSNQTLNGAS